MELAKVSQDIQVYQEMLTSCEDAHSRSEVLKLITALVESKTALLQKEARLAGTAGGELRVSEASAWPPLTSVCWRVLQVADLMAVVHRNWLSRLGLPCCCCW